jgi:hypothetical protein
MDFFPTYPLLRTLINTSQYEGLIAFVNENSVFELIEFKKKPRHLHLKTTLPGHTGWPYQHLITNITHAPRIGNFHCPFSMMYPHEDRGRISSYITPMLLMQNDL